MSKFDKEAWEKVAKVTEVMNGEAGPAMQEFIDVRSKGAWHRGFQFACFTITGLVLLDSHCKKAKEKRRLKKLERENKF